MALMAHFDLELYQMDVKTAFLNGNIEEEIYMVQPYSFEVKRFTISGLQIKEIHLWFKASIPPMVFEI